MKIDIPTDLIDQIVRGNCVAFVGSGLSRAVGLPVWPELLRQMVVWGESHGVSLPDRDELKRLIDREEYLLAAEELIEHLGNERFRRFTSEIFRKPGLRPTDVHLLLTQIPFSAVLTTNYDKLIESGYIVAREGECPHVFTQEDTPELSAALRSGEFYILKTHGTADRIETIVLGRRHYRDLMFSKPAYRKFLDTLFSSKTILFLGFGLKDPDLLLRLDELQAAFAGYTGTHYALMDETQMSSIERRRLEKDYGIQIIPYTPSAKDHPEVKHFLTELAEKLPRKMIWHTLEQAKRLIDDADPHYRLVFNTKNEVTIEEKYPGASEKSPLKFSTEVKFDTKTPEGREAHEAWKRHVATGETVTIKSPHLVKFIPPELISRFMEVPTESMEMTIGVRRGQKKMPVKIVVESADGETAAVDNIILENIQSGEEQMILSNESQDSPWKIHQVLKWKQNESDFNITFSDVGLNVRRALDGWRIAGLLAEGGKVLIISEETGGQLGHGEIAPGSFPTLDPRIRELMETLAFIQSKTSVLFTSPKTVTPQDARNTFLIREALETGRLQLKAEPVTVDSLPAQAHEILRELTEGTLDTVYNYFDEHTMVAFGQRVSLGPALVVRPIHIEAGELERVRKELDGILTGDIIHISLSPSDKAPPEMKFIDLLPETEAEEIRRKPFVRVASIKGFIQILAETVKVERGTLDVDRFIDLLAESRTQVSDNSNPINALNECSREELLAAFEPALAEISEEEKLKLAAKIVSQDWLPAEKGVWLAGIPLQAFLSSLGARGVESSNLAQSDQDAS